MAEGPDVLRSAQFSLRERDDTIITVEKLVTCLMTKTVQTTNPNQKIIEKEFEKIIHVIAGFKSILSTS